MLLNKSKFLLLSSLYCSLRMSEMAKQPSLSERIDAFNQKVEKALCLVNVVSSGQGEGRSRPMIADYMKCVAGGILLQLLDEATGHRALLYFQSKPGDSHLFPVFTYPFGSVIQESLGPSPVTIEGIDFTEFMV